MRVQRRLRRSLRNPLLPLPSPPPNPNHPDQVETKLNGKEETIQIYKLILITFKKINTTANLHRVSNFILVETFSPGSPIEQQHPVQFSEPSPSRQPPSSQFLVPFKTS